MKIYFRSMPQAVLFEQELKGQISDGHWENARPKDHWVEWCEATIGVDPDSPGVVLASGIPPKRKNYNFSDKELLESVGNRMKSYVRIALAFGRQQVEALQFVLDIDGNYRGLPEYPGQQWDKIRIEIESALKRTGRTFDDLEGAINNEALYPQDRLLSDLRDMKKIIKVYL